MAYNRNDVKGQIMVPSKIGEPYFKSFISLIQLRCYTSRIYYDEKYYFKTNKQLRWLGLQIKMRILYSIQTIGGLPRLVITPTILSTVTA
jgi:hypothetical protein